MIFIDYNLVSALWQWSADLYKNRKITAQKEKKQTKQYKNKTETQNTQNRKQKYKTEHKHKNNIESRLIGK